ncbi:hypothetical protein HHX47_DHR3000206 [Lentinula edodes]|nr:hypothetical protein HHX47_DHR3000206 [Lentinula edodes]
MPVSSSAGKERLTNQLFIMQKQRTLIFDSSTLLSMRIPCE